ncbi:MAG: TlpA family protein disulfide reductase [Candidatus Angelobacter sp.]
MKWIVTISACCIVLLGTNVALIRQNQQLKTQLSQPPPTFEAVRGTQMPDLRGFDVAGKPLELVYGQDQRKVLVLVFSPTCAFCDENWPKWAQAIPSLNREAVRPVAVDVTATANPAFLSQHQIPGMPVFVQVDPRAMLSYRFHLTPQTILLDREGKVERVWTGVLSQSDLVELKQLAD